MSVWKMEVVVSTAVSTCWAPMSVPAGRATLLLRTVSVVMVCSYSELLLAEIIIGTIIIYVRH